MMLLLALLATSDAALLAVLARTHRDQIALAADAAEHALQRRRGGRHARAVSAPHPLRALRYTGGRRLADDPGTTPATLKEVAA
jgi:hypothetical protein